MPAYGLTESQSKKLQRIEMKIRSILKRSVFETGEQLLEAKRMLKHGAFGDWVKVNLGITPRTARLYIAATQRFAKAEIISALPTTVLLELSPKSVPDEAVQQVVNLVGDGEKVTVHQAKKIISDYRSLDASIDEPDVVDAVSVDPVSQTPAAIVGSDGAAGEAAPEQAATPRQDAIWIWEKYGRRKDDLLELLRLLSKGADSIGCKPKDWLEKPGDFDPASLTPPGKLNCPEFKAMWSQWCNYNELIGSPLYEPVAAAQMNQLKGRPVDKACKCLEKAMADRLLAIPAMKELPKRFKPPTVEEVAGFIKERHVEHVDPVEFVNHYQKQGWKIKSGTPVTDWKAAVFQWQARAKKDRGKKSFNEIYSTDIAKIGNAVDPSAIYGGDSTA